LFDNLRLVKEMERIFPNKIQFINFKYLLSYDAAKFKEVTRAWAESIYNAE